MYARVWYEDGAVSDRPMNIEWDGCPVAEWPAVDRDRVAVGWQAFHDGTPLIDRCTMRHVIPAGCTHACVGREHDLLDTELSSAVTIER